MQAICRLCTINQTKQKNFIYFVHDLDVNRIKIGYTANLKGRIHTLLYGPGVCTERKLLYTIPGKRAKEMVLHEMFAAYQWNKNDVGGREWFNNENNVIIDFIETLKGKNKKISK